MNTVFLDIDGTLLLTGGAGLRSIAEIMRQHYGVGALPKVEVHGCTDFGIWRELFAKLELPFPNDLTPLIDEYCQLLDQHLDRSKNELLPGVEELLRQLVDADDIETGLLTGNAKNAAYIKLHRFGVAEYVGDFGGFGDRTANRNEVAALAVESARAALDDRFSVEQSVVIGDTAKDVECARSIGAKVVAVATGGQSLTQLEEAGADVVLEDLADTSQVVARIRELCEAARQSAHSADLSS